jgi:hypothetical protein
MGQIKKNNTQELLFLKFINSINELQKFGGLPSVSQANDI